MARRRCKFRLDKYKIFIMQCNVCQKNYKTIYKML
jgi:hypothetical protein